VIDNQSSVEIHVLQGEREVAAGNRSLGKFELVGLPAAPRGGPQIEVSFEVDANGILSVAAQDKASGRQQQMKITPTSGLSPDEIDLLISEAASAENRDQRTKEIINLRNRLDGLTRNTQRTFREVGQSLSPDEREDAQHAFELSATVAQSEDEEEIRRALGEVERVAAVLTTALFNAPAASGSTSAATPAKGPEAKDTAFERF
jgi:molecular chaperone DnaK